MAVEDIRIKINFKNHRKRRKLKKLLGPHYLDYLLDIWLTVAEEKPNGELVGWNLEDLVDAASATTKFRGNYLNLEEALIESGFLEKNGSNFYKIHDWESHQKWVIKSPDREAKARHAAMVREVKRNYCDKCTGHVSEMCPEMCPLMISEMCPFMSTGSSPAPYLNPSFSLPFLTYSISNRTPCSPPLAGGQDKKNGFTNTVRLRCNGCHKECDVKVTDPVVLYLKKTKDTNIPALKMSCEHCEQYSGYEYLGVQDGS